MREKIQLDEEDETGVESKNNKDQNKFQLLFNVLGGSPNLRSEDRTGYSKGHNN